MLIFLKNLYFSNKSVFPVNFSVSTQVASGGKPHEEREVFPPPPPPPPSLHDVNTSKSLQCRLRLELTNVAK